MNRFKLIGAVIFLQSIFAITQAQATLLISSTGIRESVARREFFSKHLESYLQAQLKQVLPLRLLKEVNSGEIFDKLLAGEAFAICSDSCTIDKLYGGYKSLETGLSQRVSSLGGWTKPIPRAENNFNALKESIYNHVEEIFSDPGILKYSKLDGSVIMISGGIWYQYPFSFDGYANETITIADTIIKDPANTFQLRTDTQPSRSFSANLVLRIGKPQHQYLVASGFYWRNLAEKLGESVVRDWYNHTTSPTPDQLDQVVNFLYSNNPTSKEFLLDDLYMAEQLSRHWRSSAGFEPLVSDPDRQLARDLAEQRDVIFSGWYRITSSSRDLINEALDKAKVSLIELRPKSLSASVHSSGSFPNVSLLTYDLITRHLDSELVVDHSTVEKLFQTLTDRDVKVHHFEKQIHEAIAFERLLHRYQLAKKANHDLSEIDQQIRNVLDHYQY